MANNTPPDDDSKPTAASVVPAQDPDGSEATPGRERMELDAKGRNQLYTMCQYRMPMHHIAAVLGMSKSTLERIIKKDPAAREALEKGRAMASFKVSRTAFEMAASGAEPKMTMFWLKTQERWRETDRLELTGENGGPVTTQELTPAARRKLIAERLERLKHSDDEADDE